MVHDPHSAADASSPRGDSPQGTPRSLPVIALLAAALAVLFVVFLRLSDTVPANSDDASPVLAAFAVLHGNPLLRGWNLATVNYYTTDLLWYDAGVALFGLDPRLMHVIPALIFTSVVGLAVALAFRRGRARPWLSAGVTFALLGLPSLGLTEFVLMGPLHMGALLLALVCLLLIDRPLTGRLWAALTVVLGVSVFGDAITLWALGLPLMAVCALRWLGAHGPNRVAEARLVGACLCAVVAAKAALTLVRHLHGFDTTGVGQGFATFGGLGHNLGLLTRGLFSLFGADYFGRILNVGSLLLLLHLAGLILVAASLRWVLASPALTAGEGDAERAGQRVDQTLAAGILLGVTAFCISSNAHGPDTVRFLVPSYLFGAILAGRVGARRLPATLPAHALMAVLGAAYLVTFGWNLHTAMRSSGSGVYHGLPPAAGPTSALETWLAGQGLHSGYGPYWSANIVTLDSRGSVQVRAVQGLNGQVVIYHWWSDSVHWYHHVPANFVVLAQNGDGGLSLADAVRTFGPPATVTVVGRDRVLTWTHDISSRLH